MPPAAGGAYVLRVANTRLGAVEASADGGERWRLLARVVQPARAVAPGGASTLPSVERAGQHGLALGVTGRRIVRVLPDSPAARRDRAAIVVTSPPASALMRELLPPPGSGVQRALGRALVPLPSGYVPADGDVLVITAVRPPAPPDGLEPALAAATTDYREGALARLRASGREPARGWLTVQARVPAGAAVQAVLFVLDGAVLAIMNRAPYAVRWDTRQWSDGEHLVEVRVVDASGIVLRTRKTLVVTRNETG